MSRNVDERVVQMEFDNAQFERNVKTSMNSIDQLKQSLQFTGVSDGLVFVTQKFSALEQVAVGALRSIGAEIVNVGRKLVNDLAIQPITDGFKEYELKIGSVQTIMAGTGASLDTVMQKLNELNAYADRTIYSFSDMTDNIGKFTNAGVDLDTAVAAIQGIANEAALSGANAAQASRAMYNFSQALSTGVVKLIDWKSIENANMGTMEFKNLLLDTAVALGTVEKTGDGMYRALTTNLQGKVMGDALSTTQMFTEALSYQWLTTDVLTKTLSQYSDETTDVGKRAFAAAQDVKTFTQLMDTLKEAVGSGWAETWENIFGNFEEAKALWSGVNKVASEIIDRQAKARNELLATWKGAGGRDDLIAALSNVFKYVLDIAKAIKEAFTDIFPPKTANDLLKLTNRLKEFSEVLKLTDDETGELNETGQKIKSTFKGVFAILGIIGDVLSAIIKPIFKLIPGIGSLGSGVLDVTANIGDMLVAFRETINSSEFLGKVTEYLGQGFEFLGNIIGKIPGAVRTLIGYLPQVKEFFKGFTQNAGGYLSQVRGFFKSFGEIDLGGAKTFSDKVKTIFDGLSSKIEGVKAFFQKIAPYVGGFVKLLSGLFYGIGVVLGELGKKLAAFLHEASLTDIITFINGIFKIFVNANLAKALKSFGGFGKNVNAFVKGLKELTDGISKASKKLGNNVLKFAISMAILAGSVYLLSRIDIPALITAGTAIATLMYLMHVVTKDMGATIGKDQKVSSGATQIIAFSVAILILAKALKKISDIDPTQMAVSVSALGILILALYAVTDRLSKRSDKDIGGGLSQLMAIAAAVLILSVAIKRLSALNLVQMGLGLAAVSVLIAELKWAMKGLSNNGMSGKQILASSIYIMAFASGIKKLASVLVDLSSLQWDSLARGITGLTVVIGEVVIATKLLANNKNGAKALTASAVGLLIFVGVIKLMASMSWDTIGHGLLAIGAAFATLAVSAALMTPVIDTIVKFGKSFWKISVGMLALAAAMMVFSVAAPLFYASAGLIGKGIVILLGELIAAIPKLISVLVESLYQSAEDIIEFIASTIGLICAAIRTRAQDIVDTVLDLLVLVIDGLAQRAEPIYEDLLEIFVFGFLDALGDKISESIPRLAEDMKAIFTALVDALSVFGAGDMLETLAAVDTLQKIMWKLSLIAGMVWLASGTFPKIGTKLGEFGTNVMPFFRALRIVTPAHLVASKSLAEMLTIITSAGIKDALTSWFTGKTRLADLGQELADFAPKFATYARNVKNMDPQKVIDSADALKALTNVWVPYVDSSSYEEFGKGLEALGERLGTYGQNVDGFPKDSAIASAEAITELSTALYNLQTVNTEDITLFAQGLVEFAPYLVHYADLVSTMNVGSVVNSMVAANAIVDFANEIPNSGGFKDIFTGGNDMNLFGSFLKSFGKSMLEYSNTVMGLDTLSVVNSMVAANAIVDFAKRIPNSGGALGLLAGNNDMSDFGVNLKTFGAALFDYGIEVQSLNITGIIASVVAADAVIDMAKRIPNSGGFKDIISDGNDMNLFGSFLKSFGKAMFDYGISVMNLNVTDIVTSSAAANAIIDFAKRIPNSGGALGLLAGNNDLGDFGVNLKTFGEALSGYGDAVDGLKNYAIGLSINSANAVIDIAKRIPNSGGFVDVITGSNDMNLFGSFARSFGQALHDYGDAVDGLKNYAITMSTESAMAIIDIANQVPNDGGLWGLLVGNNRLSDFGVGLSTFGEALRDYGDSVDGIKTYSIQQSLEPARSLIELGNSLGTGSLKGELFGYKTFSDFGTELVAFGESLVGFSDFLGNVDTTRFGRIAAALNLLTSIKVDELEPVLEQMTNLMDVIFSIDSISAGGNAEALATALSDLATTGIEGLATAFEDPERINAAVDGLISNIDSAVSGKESDVEGIATDLANAFIRQMATDLRNGKRTIGQSVLQMVSHLRSYRYQFYQAGGYLVEGFAGGIDSSRWKAEAAGRAMVKKTFEAVQAEEDARSPSRKAAIFGGYLVDGFIKPVYDRIDDLRKAGKTLAAETLDATNAVISRVADYIDSDVDAQPTIRPVLDLTDVTAGVHQLGAMFSQRQAVGISARMGELHSTVSEGDGTSAKFGNTYNYTQNNYSPKALNASEIYRNTRNQFSRMKGWALPK